MKLWIKYIIAAIIGVALGLIIPASSVVANNVLATISEFVIRIGRYMLLPLVFFSSLVAFSKLRSSRIFTRVIILTLVITIISTAVATILGFLSVVLIDIPRIPVVTSTNTKKITLGMLDFLRSIFPLSAFETLDNGTFILPTYFFALLLGTATTTDKVTFKPVLQLADSLSRLIYNINTVLTEFLPVGIIILFANVVTQLPGIIAHGTYNILLIVIIANFLLIALVIWPLVMRFLCNDRHPYRIIYASLSSLIAAAASGNESFVLPLATRHLKESLGIHRRINSVTSPLLLVFSHCGSALICIPCFIVIYHSYSSLAISLSDILLVSTVSFILSFFATGGNTIFTCLCVLCQFYGQGLENGHLLLQPIAFILISFSALFDTLTIIFGTYIVGVKTRYIEHRDIQKYI